MKRIVCALLAVLMLLTAGCEATPTGDNGGTTEKKWGDTKVTGMINNKAEGAAGMLESVKSTVYEPVSDWSYSHHAHIAWFQGKFYAIWSNGMKNEDDLGQRVMIASSEDGESWDTPRPLVTPAMLGDETKVLTAGGFHTDGSTLYVFFGSYNYKTESVGDDNVRPEGDVSHENTQLSYVSSTDGHNWSAPVDMGIAMVPNFGPQQTNSGRWILTGNVMFPYTDDPNGIADYQLAGIYGEAFGNETPVDDSASIHQVTEFNGWKANLICEGSFYQTDDDVLHMMLRSNSGYLWHSESADDGVTWSDPQQTAYTDDGSKFHFGRLPDGRIYCVSNTKRWGQRLPLDLFISEDGENFNKHYIVRNEGYEMKVEGLYKGGIYGYPHTLIHEGYMYVIYSKRKETIEVTKIDLSQI